MSGKRRKVADRTASAAESESEEEESEEEAPWRGDGESKSESSSSRSSSSGTSCHTCGQEGHMSRECPDAPAASASSSAPRTHDPRFKVPTATEAAEMRQMGRGAKVAQSASKLMDMQIAALLKKLAVNYGRCSDLEAALFSLKAALDAVPDQTVGRDSLADTPGLRLSSFTRKDVALDFEKPSRVDIVGSYLLRSVCRPSCNIDLAVEMPVSCFVAKDFLDRRYADKRALYLGVLARVLESCECVESVALGSFRGDASKPILLLKPACKTKFVIRLLPCVAWDTFAATRLDPRRGNLRLTGLSSTAGGEDEGEDEDDDEDEDEEQGRGQGQGKGKGKGDAAKQEMVHPASPDYNNGVLEDMCFRRHLLVLHGAAIAVPAFAEALMLTKMWLRQRHLDFHSSDTAHGFIMSMLLAHLVHSGRVSASASARQLFNVLLDFIATSKELVGGGLLLRTAAEAAGDDDASDEALEAHAAAYDVVMLDEETGCNVAARVSRDALDELRHEAALVGQAMREQGAKAANVGMLFMSPVDFWVKFDEYIVVDISTTGHECDASNARRRVASVLRSALCTSENSSPWTDGAGRVSRLRTMVVSNPKAQGGGGSGASMRWARFCGEHWSMDACAPTQNRTWVAVGLALNASEAARGMDKGPAANAGNKALDFRRFWGDKSELRRFKDGSILEAVLWSSGSSGEGGAAVVGRIADHVLRRHLGKDAGLAVRGSGGEGAAVSIRLKVQTVADNLNSFLAPASAAAAESLAGASGEGGAAAGLRATVNCEDGTRHLLRVFAVLEEALKDLKAPAMPLTVVAAHPVGSEYRYSSVSVPMPHRLAWGRGEPSADAHSDSSSSADPVSRVVPALEVVLQLEGSSRWPGSLDAVRAMKTALHVRLADCLETFKGSEMQCTAARGHVDVELEGFCFRLFLQCPQEVELLRRKVGVSAGNSIGGFQFGAPPMIMGGAGGAGEDAPAATSGETKKELFEAELLQDRMALHDGSMHGLHMQHTAVGPTVRLAKLWAASHMLSGVLTGGAIECIVASLFVDPEPFTAPCSAPMGFLRFLQRLSTHDWDTAPLVVDLDGALTTGEKRSIRRAFERSTAGGKTRPSMWIITPADKVGIGGNPAWTPTWTFHRPDRVAASRIVHLAKSSMDLVVPGSGANGASSVKAVRRMTTPASWLKLFTPHLADFDVVLRLNKAALPQTFASAWCDVFTANTAGGKGKGSGSGGRGSSYHVQVFKNRGVDQIETLVRFHFVRVLVHIYLYTLVLVFCLTSHVSFARAHTTRAARKHTHINTHTLLLDLFVLLFQMNKGRRHIVCVRGSHPRLLQYANSIPRLPPCLSLHRSHYLFAIVRFLYLRFLYF